MPPTNGHKIRQLRRSRGIKLGAFTAKVEGVTANTLAAIEGGFKDAGYELLHRIARVLEIDVTELLADESGDTGDPAA
jgi:transcriptional regulator with XRE-family HTH domain